jgi:hypothetical protein
MIPILAFLFSADRTIADTPSGRNVVRSSFIAVELGKLRLWVAIAAAEMSKAAPIVNPADRNPWSKPPAPENKLMTMGSPVCFLPGSGPSDRTGAVLSAIGVHVSIFGRADRDAGQEGGAQGNTVSRNYQRSKFIEAQEFEQEEQGPIGCVDRYRPHRSGARSVSQDANFRYQPYDRSTDGDRACRSTTASPRGL